jgi:hypothetical protein
LSYQVDGPVSRDEYFRAVAEALLGVLGGDFVMWNAVRLDAPAIEAVVHPVPGPEAERLGRRLCEVLEEHPMRDAYLREPRDRPPRPRRLSDVATRRELERNRAYVDVLRPSGASHQLTVLASAVSLGSTRGWAVSRSAHDFPDSAVEAAAQLQPVLAVLDRTFGALEGTLPSAKAPSSDSGSPHASCRSCGWWRTG